MTDRETLNMPAFDAMDDFAPRAVVSPVSSRVATALVTPAEAAETRRAIDAVSKFPSREASQDAQMNLKGPRHVLDRFRALCRADRRAYYDMLEILMDSFEGKPPRS